MKKKFNFTQARIKELSPPKKGRFDYSDEEITKLICRVSHTGSKSFIVRKRVSGKLKNVTIAKFPDISVTEARKRAHVILAELSAGIDPIAAKKKKNAAKTTLSKALELHIEGRDLKETTIKDYQKKLELGFSDWLKKPVSAITEDMVLSRQKKITKKSGKTTANNTMRVLRLTLKYANAVGMVDNVATEILNKARLWHKNKRKITLIASHELKAWHEAVEGLSNQKAKVYLLMAIYMGLRSKETRDIEWSHVDLKKQTVTLYNTKNRSDRTLPIPEPLFTHLKSLKELTGHHKLVFAGKDGVKPMSIPKNPIAKVIKQSGVQFSPHDCRRTFATISEAVSLPLTMSKLLMNHVKSNDVTGGYIITEEETLRAASNKVASYIQARVTQKDNVIQLRTTK